MNPLPNLTDASLNKRPLIFDIQNCNSLNLTGLTSNFDLKMTAILRGDADIIFLSDTRIISNKGISSSQRIKNCLRDSGAKKSMKSSLIALPTVEELLCWSTGSSILL
jgi:hypothetical protein